MKRNIYPFVILFFLILSLCSCEIENSMEQDKDEKPIEFPDGLKKSKHPFLIITKEMYPQLRNQ